MPNQCRLSVTPSRPRSTTNGKLSRMPTSGLNLPTHPPPPSTQHPYAPEMTFRSSSVHPPLKISKKTEKRKRFTTLTLGLLFASLCERPKKSTPTPRLSASQRGWQLSVRRKSLKIFASGDLK
ncbi:hypothetical protein AVEN_140870-1 [Araneus ventricosus]|uniref:Uncharacterized protein n=1 Tax=Araneus ventricosus TaxID=182803 RepID=A0A4Y2KML8_ARAVE|nr:hypothetical protein AVEN_192532-1 [Araneus ventricosus]GBN03882.1 hypothetical protein AVEN_140870-1 [Araneus ventricosus]